jgi:hypothetical protein
LPKNLINKFAKVRTEDDFGHLLNLQADLMRHITSLEEFLPYGFSGRLKERITNIKSLCNTGINHSVPSMNSQIARLRKCVNSLVANYQIYRPILDIDSKNKETSLGNISSDLENEKQEFKLRNNFFISLSQEIRDFLCDLKEEISRLTSQFEKLTTVRHQFEPSLMENRVPLSMMAEYRLSLMSLFKSDAIKKEAGQKKSLEEQDLIRDSDEEKIFSFKKRILTSEGNFNKLNKEYADKKSYFDVEFREKYNNIEYIIRCFISVKDELDETLLELSRMQTSYHTKAILNANSIFSKFRSNVDAIMVRNYLIKNHENLTKIKSGNIVNKPILELMKEIDDILQLINCEPISISKIKNKKYSKEIDQTKTLLKSIYDLLSQIDKADNSKRVSTVTLTHQFKSAIEELVCYRTLFEDQSLLSKIESKSMSISFNMKI